MPPKRIRIRNRINKPLTPVAELKAAREQLGLSLAEVGERTGIGKSNLSRLENAADPNPTIDTLNRYAEAVGKEIVITLTEKE